MILKAIIAFNCDYIHILQAISCIKLLIISIFIIQCFLQIKNKILFMKLQFKGGMSSMNVSTCI